MFGVRYPPRDLLGAAVKVKLELVGGPVEPDHHDVVCPCRKLEEAMGWNQCQKMSALLLVALWAGVGGWTGRP